MSNEQFKIDKKSNHGKIIYHKYKIYPNGKCKKKLEHQINYDNKHINYVKLVNIDA